MLERARALTDGENPRFVAGGLADLGAQSGPFDLIAILGNTLAYVENPRELRAVLRHCYHALAQHGVLVVQMLNYAKILDQEDLWLPVVERKTEDTHYLFLREYRRQKKHVEFSLIALQQGESWHLQLERSRHFPVIPDLFIRKLLKAGFNFFNFYADYAGAPFDPDQSGSLVAVATKRE